MTILHIEWKHYQKDRTTCTRCGDTGQALHRALAQLRSELAEQGIAVTFTETILSEQDIPQSNAILLNGIPLETLIPGATTAENHCRSCSELTGRETLCRTITVGDATYAAIPETLIRQAALQRVGISPSIPVLNEPVEPCCAHCE